MRCPECGNDTIKYGHDRAKRQVYLCKQKDLHSSQRYKQFTEQDTKGQTLHLVLESVIGKDGLYSLKGVHSNRTAPTKGKELQEFEIIFLQYLALLGVEQILLAKIFNVGQSTVSKRISEVYPLRQSTIRPTRGSLIKEDVFLSNVVEKVKGNVFKKKEWSKMKNELIQHVQHLEKSYFNYGE